MKHTLMKWLLSPAVQAGWLGSLMRQAVRATDGRLHRYSAAFKLDTQATARPHYAYCMLNAARLAQRLGHDRISAIEFGVAGGNGLAFMTAYARDVARQTGVMVDCYGFDTGTGMPPPEGQADLPYWFQKAQYRMDRAALEARVPEAKLVMGEIGDTLPRFLDTHDPAPIGAILNDTDYHSSTRDSLKLFDSASRYPQHFLPRLFLYFDDIMGSEWEMYGPGNGQLRAIEDYNAAQSAVRLHRNQNLMPRLDRPWRWQIYYAHLFEHPDYTRFIGAPEQQRIESALELKR